MFVGSSLRVDSARYGKTEIHVDEIGIVIYKYEIEKKTNTEK